MNVRSCLFAISCSLLLFESKASAQWKGEFDRSAEAIATGEELVLQFSQGPIGCLTDGPGWLCIHPKQLRTILAFGLPTDTPIMQRTRSLGFEFRPQNMFPSNPSIWGRRVGKLSSRMECLA